MNGKDKRIRERAYTLWEQEGRPEGQAGEHWDRARRLIEEEEAMQQASASSGAGAKRKSPSKQRSPGTGEGKSRTRKSKTSAD